MIKANDLIRQFERMYKEHWSYVWGAAREGCVDCSGAFVYAFKQHGHAIPHGSNSIYHKHIRSVSTEPRPGYAAFKSRPWTDAEKSNSWYGQLPGDIYHIGLVDSTGKYVLNAKGTKSGFCRDPIGSWSFFAPLTAVDYGETMSNTIDYICNADKVRVRDEPNTGGMIYGHLAKGERIGVVDATGDWFAVDWAGHAAYVKGEFLQPVGVTVNPTEDVTPAKLLRQYIVSVYDDGGIAWAEYWKGGDSVESD